MDRLTATPPMLSAIPFFQDLDQPALADLAPRFQVENHRRGADLAGRGFQRLDAYEDTVYFVSRGVVALYTITKTNSRKIVFFLGPGRLLNHNVLGTRPNTLFAEVISDAILLSIPREEFSALVHAHPTLTRALLTCYETDLWRMSHQLKNTAGYLPVERKLAIKLGKLAQEFGRPSPQGTALSFPLTITQMADFVGVPRETASRACKRLGELGLVRYENRRFVIPDRERLALYCRSGQ